MSKSIRAIIALLTVGVFWYLALRLFFVWSGAQMILGNPQHQSAKFIAAFTQQPLPRMTDSAFLYKGFFVVGILMTAGFALVDKHLRGEWWRRGVTFGLIHWLLMTPWFEFYLPYNVMLEPLALVLFEGVLWFGVTLTTGLYISFIMNFKRNFL